MFGSVPTLVNPLTQWSAVLGLFKELRDSGANVANHMSPGWKYTCKIGGNAFIKLGAWVSFGRDTGFFAWCTGKQNLGPTTDYQRDFGYRAVTFLQCGLNTVSFICDILAYANNEDDYDRKEKDKLYTDLSLFLLALGVTVIGLREIVYKKDAKKENEVREKLLEFQKQHPNSAAQELITALQQNPVNNLNRANQWAQNLHQASVPTVPGIVAATAVPVAPPPFTGHHLEKVLENPHIQDYVDTIQPILVKQHNGTPLTPQETADIHNVQPRLERMIREKQEPVPFRYF